MRCSVCGGDFAVQLGDLPGAVSFTGRLDGEPATVCWEHVESLDDDEEGASR